MSPSHFINPEEEQRVFYCEITKTVLTWARNMCFQVGSHYLQYDAE